MVDFLDEAILLLRAKTREIQNWLDAHLQMKQGEGHADRNTLDPCILLPRTIRLLSVSFQQPASALKWAEF